MCARGLAARAEEEATRLVAMWHCRRRVGEIAQNDDASASLPWRRHRDRRRVQVRESDPLMPPAAGYDSARRSPPRRYRAAPGSRVWGSSHDGIEVTVLVEIAESHATSELRARADREVCGLPELTAPVVREDGESRAAEVEQRGSAAPLPARSPTAALTKSRRSRERDVGRKRPVAEIAQSTGGCWLRDAVTKRSGSPSPSASPTARSDG